MAGTMEHPEEDDSVPLVVGVRVIPHDRVNAGAYEIEGRCIDMDLTKNEIIFNQERTFQYDCVYPENTSQDSVYQSSLEPFLSTLLDGYSVSVLLYGASCTGKSYTLYGPELGPAINEEEFGFIPRFLRGLYHTLTETCVKYKVTLSFCDIYNSELVDLLAEPDLNTEDKALNIQIDEFGRARIDNLSEIECENISEALSCVNLGLAYHKSKTANVPELKNLPGQINENVHSLVKVGLKQFLFNNGVLVCKDSCIHFIECAPCDQVYPVNNPGLMPLMGLVGAPVVNRGILTLNNVISALGDHRRNVSHVPFKDSLLTQLLSPALGGNSVTFLMATISAASLNLEATLSTLLFASYAANICTKPVPVIYPVLQNITEPNMRLVPQQPSEIIHDAHHNNNQLVNNLHNNQFPSEGHHNLNIILNQPNNHFMNETPKFYDHQPSNPFTMINRGQFNGHLNGPSHMTSHPPINLHGQNLVSQYTSFPTLNPQSQMSPYTNPFQNIPFSQENHVNQYLKEVYQLKQEEARVQLQLNPNPGTIAASSPSFASHSSRVAPWHSTPDAIAKVQNIIQHNIQNNVNPMLNITGNQPSSECTSPPSEVSPLPYAPALGVNMYLHNTDFQRPTSSAQSSHKQTTSLQHHQVQYLASNGQKGASSSISKCDSSLLESMSLNFSRADQTIETFIQPPVLGNQGHIILPDRNTGSSMEIMTAPLPSAHHLIQESRAREEYLYQHKLLSKGQTNINKMDKGQQNSLVSQQAQWMNQQVFNKVRTEQQGPVVGEPLKLADLEKLSKILEESEEDCESRKSSKFSSSNSKLSSSICSSRMSASSSESCSFSEDSDVFNSMDSINSHQLRLSLQQYIQTSIHEKSIKSSIKSVKSVTRDKTLESVEIKRSITENKDPVGDIEIDEVTDSDADIRKEVYSSQDFNSECSDVSQLDLKLQCAQEQLKIQNRQLFKQYLENLLANKNLQAAIEQFETRFVEQIKSDNDNLDDTTEIDQNHKETSFPDVELPIENHEKIRDELKTLSDLVDKTKSQLEDHKDLVRGKQSLLKEIKRTRNSAGDFISKLTSQVEQLGKETRRAQHHLLTNQIELAKLENQESTNSHEERSRKQYLSKNIEKYSDKLRYFEKKSNEVQTTLSLVNPGARSFNKLEQSIESLDAEYKVIKRKYRDQLQRKKSLENKLAQALQNPTSINTDNQEKRGIKDNEENKSTNEINIENPLISQVKSLAIHDTKQNKSIESIDNKPMNEQKMNDDNKINEMNKLSITEQIAGLRIIREAFISERLHLEEKLDEYKFLSPDEEKQIVELDESVEAIDAAIDYKNDLLRQKAVDYSVPCGNPLLDRLACLEIGEVRSLLHKTFIRVLDLRMEGRKLEIHVEDVEEQYNQLGKYARDLGHSLQRCKLDAERRLVNQEKQFQTKINQLVSNMNSQTEHKNHQDIKKLKKLEKELKYYKEKYQNQKESSANNEIEFATDDLEKTLTNKDKTKLRDVRKLVDLSHSNKKKIHDVNKIETLELTRFSKKSGNEIGKKSTKTLTGLQTYEFTDATSETETENLGAVSKNVYNQVETSRKLGNKSTLNTQNNHMINQFQKRFAQMQAKLESVAKPSVIREHRKLIIENPLAASHSSDRTDRDRRKEKK